MPDNAILHPNLATALVAARAEFTPVKKTHTAKVVTAKGSYEYRFATLDEINDATQPALQRHGLAIVQKLSSPDGGNVGIQTVLLFGAESLDCGTLVMPTGGTPQSIGSACTYGRRYGVTAALMIATEDDDDGQVAQHATDRSSTPATRTPAPAAKPAAAPERQAGDEPDDPFGDFSEPVPDEPRATHATLHLGPSNGSPIVSEARAKRCFAIGAKALGSGTALKEWLKANTPYGDPREILAAHYDPICNALEAMQPRVS